MDESFKTYFPSNPETRDVLSEAQRMPETSHHISRDNSISTQFISQALASLCRWRLQIGQIGPTNLNGLNSTAK